MSKYGKYKNRRSILDKIHKYRNMLITMFEKGHITSKMFSEAMNNSMKVYDKLKSL